MTATPPRDESALIEASQAGDPRALDELVRRNQDRVYSFAMRMCRNVEDAKDILQETFLGVVRSIRDFRAESRFSTWLYRIAHNVVYDWTRKKRIEGVGELNDEVFERDRIDPASATTPDAGESPDEAMARSELRVKIEAALAKLSPEHREVVLLKDVQGLAYKEIAEVMGSSIGTVMSRLFYARQKLQTLLRHEYETR